MSDADIQPLGDNSSIDADQQTDAGEQVKGGEVFSDINDQRHQYEYDPRDPFNTPISDRDDQDTSPTQG
jgi:hypothetical protein